MSTDERRTQAAALRADVPGTGLPADLSCTAFTFDGQPILALPGQSVGAALTSAGQRSWRTTRFAGRPRGLFCGIGVCFDCLVTVDGQPNLRACMTPATDGAAVTTQEGPGRYDA